MAKTERGLHDSTASTRERSYEKLREAGIPKDNAKKIAEQATRETHEAASKRK